MIKILKRDVLSYKTDNQKLMKYQEEKNNINTKLLQSLDNLHKNMDKEEDSRKVEDHNFHARRE